MLPNIEYRISGKEYNPNWFNHQITLLGCLEALIGLSWSLEGPRGSGQYRVDAGQIALRFPGAAGKQFGISISMGCPNSMILRNFPVALQATAPAATGFSFELKSPFLYSAQENVGFVGLECYPSMQCRV